MLREVVEVLRHHKRVLAQVVNESGRPGVVSQHVIVNRKLIHREGEVSSRREFTFVHGHWQGAPVERLLIEAEREVGALVAFEVALLLFVSLKLIWIDGVSLIDEEEVAFAEELAYLIPGLASGSFQRVTSHHSQILVLVCLKSIVAFEAHFMAVLPTEWIGHLVPHLWDN